MSRCGVQTQVEVRIWWSRSAVQTASTQDLTGSRQLPVLAEEAPTVWPGIVIHAWKLGALAAVPDYRDKD